jgi:hypothetical protein
MPTTPNQNLMITGVYLCLDANSMITTPQPQIMAAFAGLEGDRHYGFTRLSNGRWPWYPRGTEIRNDRQVSLVSAEEMAAVAAELGVLDVRAEWLGANLLTQGFAGLTLLPPNTRLFFPSGAVLVITAENLPCSDPAKIITEKTGVGEAARLFPKVAMHKRGLVAVVERPGLICPGDEVRIDTP